jgi:lipopolysaccharide/colanic/teichoic acid biosynthesis glycosyltransferase
VKPSAYFAQKDLLERALAAIMLIPCSLVILFMVFLVRITSRGPGIYRQERVGRNGQIFTMYKIRTMRANAEENTGAVWSPRSDPRITRVGRILRRLHLDEFPQIYNVLRGDMSLIGPRPERPEFVDILEKKVPGYSLRHSVKPGITGLAQINLPPDVNLSCVRRKLTLDLEYIMTANLSLDARMFLCSGFALLGIPGHFCKRAMNIKRTVQLPVAQETKEPDQRDAA